MARAERIGVVVQARMSSTRLPGKVLRPLAGEPALGRLLDSVGRSAEADVVAVATSDRPEDDAIAAFCEGRETACVRGPLEDVAARYAAAAAELELDAFVRVTADSPLLDHRVVDELVRAYRAGGWDVVTNVFPQTFAAGQSVEVVGAAAFARACAAMTTAYEREHVTPHLYAHPDRFAIHNVVASQDDSALHLALDTREDAATIERVLQAMDRPPWDYTSAEIALIARSCG